MNLITSTISSEGFPGTLRSIFADCFWRTLFCSTHKKMHIAEYVCKTCLKELGIFLNCWETLKNFLQPATLLKILLFHNFFSKVSDNCILRTTISQQKPKDAYYADFYEIETNEDIYIYIYILGIYIYIIYIYTCIYLSGLSTLCVMVVGLLVSR